MNECTEMHHSCLTECPPTGRQTTPRGQATSVSSPELRLLEDNSLLYRTCAAVMGVWASICHPHHDTAARVCPGGCEAGALVSMVVLGPWSVAACRGVRGVRVQAVVLLVNIFLMCYGL